MKDILSRRTLYLCAFAFICTASSVANAGLALTTLNVTASVRSNCTISTTPVAFGNYDSIGANAKNALEKNGTVTVTCTKNIRSDNFWIALGKGQNFNKTPAMKGKNSGELLYYSLYQPSSNKPGAACSSPYSRQVVWGNGRPGPGSYGNAMKLTSSSNKAPRTYNICGSIPGGQDVSVGDYSDTVIATVNF